MYYLLSILEEVLQFPVILQLSQEFICSFFILIMPEEDKQKAKYLLFKLLK